MKLQPPFRYCEATFFAGLLDDPVLLVHIRPLGKSILFDCGNIQHLAKRVLKSVTAIFISHAHMDHFMGMDSYIRQNHVSPKTVDIFGPPGITMKMAAKLSSYDWNLYEPYWCSFRVHEIGYTNIVTSLFSGPAGFSCSFESEQPCTGTLIYRNELVQVDATLLDHKLPVLAFRLTERPAFLVDRENLSRAELVPGEWLRELKKQYCSGGIPDKPIVVLKQDMHGIREELVANAATLYKGIQRTETPGSIGYLTDVGFTKHNIDQSISLLKGARLLVCECSFLHEDQDKARASYHLCTSDIRKLVQYLCPTYLLPMHLSKTYIHRSAKLYEQLSGLPEVKLLKIPDHLTPRPLLRCEVPDPLMTSGTE
jgi:ribonuclease Z